MNDLKSLIIEAQRGDLVAFGRLVRRFQNMAYGYAYGILGDFHLAEDVVQETFLEAYRQLSELRNVEAFSMWLRSIVFKYCDRLTRRKQIEMVGLDVIPHLISDAPNPDDVVAQKEVKDQVVQVIQNLPEKERVVTSLFYMNEYSLKEVATFLEVPVSTVKNRLHTARQLIKERMVDMVDENLQAFRLPDRFSDVIVQMQFVLGQVNPLEKRMQALTDDQLSVKGAELQRRLEQGESRDDIKAEAFALVKEASRRVLGMAHYDVQLVAGLMMDSGWVAEVASGEGKSLICLLPAYMAVLEGKRAHVITLNDHLAQRDAEMAAQVFSLLGVTVGAIDQNSGDKAGYPCEIVYGAYTAFAFDGLQDTLRKAGESAVQGRHDVALVDEVDRVLIHEGRTPVVLARKKALDVKLYEAADEMARALIAEQNASNILFEQHAKHPYSITITPAGIQAVHSKAQTDSDLLHRVEQALRAHRLYLKGRDYVVKDDQVIILDGETGRLVPQRRFSDGLHQALEIKENVSVQSEILSEGRLNVQDYFRKYSQLVGVTGCAKEYEDEFRERYGLTVGVVPTRQALNRIDYEDRVYQSLSGRDEGLVDEVCRYSQEIGRPVLVGVRNIEDSVRLTQLFQSRDIDCQVLDALRDVDEAQIVERVGHVGCVTIATEMVGRGTDICVSEEALSLGGLHIIGFGRHRLRVFDDQLIACAGKQGQAGSSQFFLCRDDELVVAVWEEVNKKDKKILEDTGVVESKHMTEVIAGGQAKEAQRLFELRQKLDVLEAS